MSSKRSLLLVCLLAVFAAGCAKAPSTAPPTVETRRVVAAWVQESLLSRGMDAFAESCGDQGQCLCVKWVLAGRPFAYQLLHDEGLMTRLRSAGFTRLYVRDGSEFAEDYALPAAS